MDPMQELKRAAKSGDREALYPLIADDTPIHVAVSAGNTQFAVELATLKPSLCRELNSDGWSPMHLALQHGHIKVVQALVRGIDPDLIRVKGKNGMNVLHYAASMDTISEEFICDLVKICPIAVQDLTVELDTPLHVAVKHGNFVAFKAIHRSIRVSRQNGVIINWKNIEGNTVLHLATETDQIRVVKLLTRVTLVDVFSGTWQMDVHAKNLAGRTALDIATQKQNQETWNILFRSGVVTCAMLVRPPSRMRVAPCAIFRSLLSLLLRVEWKMLYLAYSDEWPSDLQNALLVVATLIMTATYQASLSPPGGIWSPGDVADTKNNTSTGTTSATFGRSAYPIHIDHHPQVRAGSAVMGEHWYKVFTIFNTAAFTLALWVIGAVLVRHRPINLAADLSLFFLLITYFIGVTITGGAQSRYR